MSLISVIGIGMTAAVLSVILKQYKPEFGMYISLAAGIIIFGIVLNVLIPVITQVTGLAEYADSSNTYAGILMKSLAACYITSLASDACKDAGEAAVAGKIDLAGRAAIVVMSLPMWTELLALIRKLLS